MITSASDLPDLILLDLVMPKMNGWGFVRRNFATLGLPEFRSSCGRRWTPARALIEAVHFLRKPIIIDALPWAVVRVTFKPSR